MRVEAPLLRPLQRRNETVWMSSSQSVFMAPPFRSQSFPPGTPVPLALTREGVHHHIAGLLWQFFFHGQVDQCAKPWVKALIVDSISVSKFLFNCPVSRNTSQRFNLSVTVASHHVQSFTTQWSPTCLRPKLDDRLHVQPVCGFRSLGAVERGDSPLNPTVDVSK